MNVEELLNQQKLPFLPKGNDYVIKCISPDHEDRNPSMRIDKITGIFHCLSCGFKGNLFKHFGEKPNLEELRRESLKDKIRKKLAESIGLEMPLTATAYTNDWRGISGATYEKFEAFTSIDFSSRIVFPIRDISGRIVVFQGRHTTITEHPKYIFYPNGVSPPLFPQVKPILGNIILVEGLFDMLNLHDKGLDNAVCAFGTKSINEEKLLMLKIQGVTGIDIIFDGDDAGRAASSSVVELCEKMGFSHRQIDLKDGEDPGSLSEHTILKLRNALYESSNN